ncbi:glycerophosphodiester phosphodiesterase family protein [Flavobacterium gilvum]|uniref:GP-PDE domain-containing protein n=1 Tax=Flavobacterium gilvum TaxID=1492737 RepID=A0AAC9I7Y3_9FLAO|nr:glycerophosphodiester phosphodiesterase family protein [Flavobacterium gilvum]AOW11046.1 hypothetical protein EM308_16995 [Flavobacterium gilvum]KFC57991.1 hypothetical protein FEM08_32300 [Flavobacterium gilvum]
MKKKLFFTAIFCFVLFPNCSAEDENSTPSKSEKIAEPIIIAKNSIVAHRGAWKKNNFPQNSIASLREAIRLNCKGSEFDIQLTADDSLVVCHDAQYNKLTIENSKYSDLVTFKLSNGEKLPTLREYIIAGKQNNTTTLMYCEFKNYNLNASRKKVFLSKTLECVSKLNAQQYMAYLSFDFDLLKQLRLLDAYADIQNSDSNASIELLKTNNFSGVSYDYLTYINHPDWIESAQKNKLKLTVYTDYNDSNGTNYYLNKKFDAITTDEPESAIKSQAEYNQNLNTRGFNNTKLDLKLLENPTSNLISLQSNLVLEDDLKINVIDESGKIVGTKAFPKGTSTWFFETDTLKNGIYFLKISEQNSSKTIKVIINK